MWLCSTEDQHIVSAHLERQHIYGLTTVFLYNIITLGNSIDKIRFP